MSPEEYNNQRIIAKEWRSGWSCVGIILCELDGREFQAYIGCAEGNDEYTDSLHIAQLGAKLSQEEALAFFPQYEKEIKHYYK